MGTSNAPPCSCPRYQGEYLDVAVTWLVIPDWYGPLTIGWTGGLDRFRWGIDPVEERFHFGRLDD